MDENKMIRPMDFVRLTNIDESNVIKDTKNHIGLVKEVSRDGSSSGNNAQIGSSGYNAKIGSSGNNAQIGSSGYGAKIDSTGEDCVIMCAGINSVAKASKGSWITLSEWSYSEGKQRYIPICVKTEFVDGEKIKADTYYSLKGGVFVEWIND